MEGLSPAAPGWSITSCWSGRAKHKALVCAINDAIFSCLRQGGFVYLGAQKTELVIGLGLHFGSVGWGFVILLAKQEGRG